MTPSEILREGRDRVAKAWAPGSTARALNGNHEYRDYLQALFFLRAAAELGPNDLLNLWDEHATWAQAIAAYDRAIEFALSQETANV